MRLTITFYSLENKGMASDLFPSPANAKLCLQREKVDTFLGVRGCIFPQLEGRRQVRVAWPSPSASFTLNPDMAAAKCPFSKHTMFFPSLCLHTGCEEGLTFSSPFSIR
jgi:hypothetical protein